MGIGFCDDGILMNQIIISFHFVRCCRYYCYSTHSYISCITDGNFTVKLHAYVKIFSIKLLRLKLFNAQNYCNGSFPNYSFSADWLKLKLKWNLMPDGFN